MPDRSVMLAVTVRQRPFRQRSTSTSGRVSVPVAVPDRTCVVPTSGPAPVTVIQGVAERDPSFAALVAASGTDDDGIPDRNLDRVYDGLYEADSDLASRVIAREDGEYRSLPVSLTLDADYANADRVVAGLDESAALMTSDGGDRTATVAGNFSVNEAVLGAIVDGIITTTGVALAAIAFTLAALFRHMHGSATLGLVVAGPVALVPVLVAGGMYVLSISLTLLTALLMSLLVLSSLGHLGPLRPGERRHAARIDPEGLWRLTPPERPGPAARIDPTSRSHGCPLADAVERRPRRSNRVR